MLASRSKHSTSIPTPQDFEPQLLSLMTEYDLLSPTKSSAQPSYDSITLQQNTTIAVLVR